MNANVEKIMETCVSSKKLAYWMSHCEIGKIYLFYIKKQGEEQFIAQVKNKVKKEINFVDIGSKVDESSRKNGIYLTSEGEFGRYLSKFTK